MGPNALLEPGTEVDLPYVDDRHRKILKIKSPHSIHNFFLTCSHNPICAERLIQIHQPSEAKRQKPGNESEQDVYEVEAVVGSRHVGQGQVEYLVKWAGYPTSENTWERK